MNKAELINRLVDFCSELGKEDYGKISEVVKERGKPVSSAVVEVIATLDSVIGSEISPNGVIVSKGMIPIIGYREDGQVYTLAYTGKIDWTGDWIHFRDGEISLIQEPTGEIIASLNQKVFPQNAIDRLEVVAMVSNDAPAEIVQARINELREKTTVKRVLQ